MTIETDPNFWDCECDVRYVHSKEEIVCLFCGFERQDAPDSRVEEIYLENLATPEAIDEAYHQEYIDARENEWEK